MFDEQHSRRVLVMHPAHAALGPSGACAAHDAEDRRHAVPSARARTEVGRVGLFSRAADWIAPALVGPLQQHFAERRRWMSVVPLVGSAAEPVGPDALADCRCVVLPLDHAEPSPRRIDALRTFRRRGGTLVGLGSPAGVGGGWTPLLRSVFGARWFGSAGWGRYHVHAAPGGRTHPMLARFKPFAAIGHLGQWVLDDDVTVLLDGSRFRRCEPVAWLCADGAVFLALGCPEDVQSPAALRLLAAAVDWAAGPP